jgi:tetratricopeptide (TPR) repeat protein
VLEGAAVEGEVFHRGAVQVLASSDTVVTPRLAALVRRGLIRPDRAQLAGEDGFRFRHLLIRDAAYDAMPKALRAELHARFAVWLERRGADLVEIDDILGYHLEQACRYRSELGLVDEGGALAAAARTRLTAAGRRARMRHDFRAAFNLFQRATELIPGGSIELGLELDYIETLVDLGGTRQARECARGLTERAVCLNNRVAEVTAQIAEQSLLMNLDPEGAADRLGTLIEGALPTLEAAGDDLALCVAHRARGNVANMRARADGQLDGYRKAVEHAQRAGLPHLWSELLPEVGAAMLMGSTPVPDVLAWLDEQELHNPGHFGYRILRAASFAMLGRFNEARNIRDTVRRVLIDQGAALPLAATTGYIGVLIDLLAEDYHAAAEMAREACCVLEQSGERAFLSGAAGLLAAALYALDQLDEAETEADRAARMASSDDAASQMLSRQVRAKVHARRGAHAEAERLAREAVVIADETDHMNERGDAYSDLAEVLVIVGKTEKAVHTLETAATLFVQKGNVPAHERIRARLARLRASAPTSAG